LGVPIPLYFSTVRSGLRNLQPDVYRLTVADLERTLRTAEHLAESRVQDAEAEVAPLRADTEQAAVEILSDVNYYVNLELTYLWGFAIWRLQALFEGMLGQSVLPPGTRVPIGLRRKLLAVRAAGFILSDDDFQELLAWAELRNQLSHDPPTHYGSYRLQRDDAREYADLVSGLLRRWVNFEAISPYHPSFPAI
jgi:hypothetical protein